MENRDVYLNLINGQWKQGTSGQWDPNRNPAKPTEILGKTTRSTPADLEKAIEAAQTAFLEWSSKTRPFRGAILAKASQLLRSKSESLAKMITREQGKNLRCSRSELTRTTSALDFIASESRRPLGNMLPLETQTLQFTQFVPVGVVGVIGASSSPLEFSAIQIAAALLEGNTVVFKASSSTPAIGTALVRIFEEAGVPAGALNLVYGPGQTLGQALAQDSRVAALSFAGTLLNAVQVSQGSAKRLAKVRCESLAAAPLLVLASADLDKAVEGAIHLLERGANSDPIFCAQVLLDPSIEAAFTEKLVARVRTLKCGDGMTDPLAIGPMVNEKRFKAATEALELARTQGATVVAGGEIGPIDPSIQATQGYFIPPTLLKNCAQPQQLTGPVLTLSLISNNTPGGGAIIYSRSSQEILEMTQNSRLKRVSINQGTDREANSNELNAILSFFRETSSVVWAV